MAAQLGLQGIAVPEQYGGAGYGHAELAVVFEEMGRALLPSPYFATVGLAANVLLNCGDEAAVAELLPGIAAGETIATLALVEAGGRWDGSDVALRAERSGGAWTLHGSKLFVLDGTIASLVLVVARTDAGLSIFAVDGDDGAHARCRCRRWTRPASRRVSTSTARRHACSGRKAPRGHGSSGRSTTPPSHWPPKPWVVRSAAST